MTDSEAKYTEVVQSNDVLEIKITMNKAGQDNPTNQRNPTHTPSGPGTRSYHNAGYGGAGTRPIWTIIPTSTTPGMAVARSKSAITKYISCIRIYT